MKKISLRAAILLALLATFSVSLSAVTYKLPEEKVLSKVFEDCVPNQQIAQKLDSLIRDFSGDSLTKDEISTRIVKSFETYIGNQGWADTDTRRAGLFFNYYRLLAAILKASDAVEEEVPVSSHDTSVPTVVPTVQIAQHEDNDDFAKNLRFLFAVMTIFGAFGK